MEKERLEEREKHQNKFKRRKKSLEIDKKIYECQNIAVIPAKESSYKILGKNRHIQHLLKNVVDDMSQDQRDKYAVLMEDLKKNGWKVFSKYFR